MKLSETFRRNIYMVLLLLLLIYAAYSFITLAMDLEKTEIERHGKGYVSDEVWYVSSARNLLRKVFGINASIPGRYGASIIFNETILYNTLKKIAAKHNVSIVDSAYHDIKAVYVEAYSRRDIEEFASEFNGKVIDIVYGWRIPDAANIHEYLNTEHPPMVKYLIALSISLLGDRPFYWRIPSIIAGVLLVFTSYLLASMLTSNKWIGLLVGLFVTVDPLTKALSSIALLDIYVALFTTLAFIPLIRKKYILSFIIIAIGSTFKFSVLFASIPVIILYIRDDLKRDPRPLTLVASILRSILIIIILFGIAQFIVSIPLILYLGVNGWLDQSIFGAIAWHTSVKCTGSCPLTSTPLDWFLGANGFPLYYFPDNRGLIALGLWPFWVISLASGLLFLPGYLVDRRFGYSDLLLLGTWSGYVLLWFIGGRTQYSFYSVQFVSLVYLLLIVSITYMLLKPVNGRRTIYYWYKVLTWCWKIFLTVLSIR